MKPRLSLRDARRRIVARRREQGEIALRAVDLKKKYRADSRFELSSISLELVPGEILGVVGENGSGKTTLLRILRGELAFDGGRVEYPMLESRARNYRQLRRQIAYVPQELETWYGRVIDNLHLEAALHGFVGRNNDNEVKFAVHRLGLLDYTESKWRELSSGFKMRCELARALVSNASLLILDEPLAPLDINSQYSFLQDLRDLASSVSRPLPIVVSSQHLYGIESVADKMLFLKDGRCEFSGLLQDLYEQRTGNFYELGCQLPSRELEERLAGLPAVRARRSGTSMVLTTAKDVDSSAVLRKLLEAGVAIDYFRDASSSTRSLFPIGDEYLPEGDTNVSEG